MCSYLRALKLTVSADEAVNSPRIGIPESLAGERAE